MAIAPNEEYHSSNQFQQLSLLDEEELAALQASPPRAWADHRVRKVRRPKDNPRQDQLPFPSER